jgi:hypothetical protein
MYTTDSAPYHGMFMQGQPPPRPVQSVDPAHSSQYPSAQQAIPMAPPGPAYSGMPPHAHFLIAPQDHIHHGSVRGILDEFHRDTVFYYFMLPAHNLLDIHFLQLEQIVKVRGLSSRFEVGKHGIIKDLWLLAIRVIQRQGHQLLFQPWFTSDEHLLYVNHGFRTKIPAHGFFDHVRHMLSARQGPQPGNDHVHVNGSRPIPQKHDAQDPEHPPHSDSTPPSVPTHLPHGAQAPEHPQDKLRSENVACIQDKHGVIFFIFFAYRVKGLTANDVDQLGKLINIPGLRQLFTGCKHIHVDGLWMLAKLTMHHDGLDYHFQSEPFFTGHDLIYVNDISQVSFQVPQFFEHVERYYKRNPHFRPGGLQPDPRVHRVDDEHDAIEDTLKEAFELVASERRAHEKSISLSSAPVAASETSPVQGIHSSSSSSSKGGLHVSRFQGVNSAHVKPADTEIELGSFVGIRAYTSNSHIFTQFKDEHQASFQTNAEMETILEALSEQIAAKFDKSIDDVSFTHVGPNDWTIRMKATSNAHAQSIVSDRSSIISRPLKVMPIKIPPAGTVYSDAASHAQDDDNETNSHPFRFLLAHGVKTPLQQYLNTRSITVIADRFYETQPPPDMQSNIGQNICLPSANLSFVKSQKHSNGWVVTFKPSPKRRQQVRR